MKALVCELCGSVDLVKEGEYFVCQHCGCKYDLEAAKKMMVEGVVKIDTSDELEKLYKAARNARETGDTESALRHYEKISSQDPDSWEALFYLVVLKAEKIKNGEIESVAFKINECLHKIFELINANVDGEDDKKKAIKEIVEKCITVTVGLTLSSKAYYDSIAEIHTITFDIKAIRKALAEHLIRCVQIAVITDNCGNYIEEFFDSNDEFYKSLMIKSWKTTFEIYNGLETPYKNEACENIKNNGIKNSSEKIKKYDPSFGATTKKVEPQKEQSSGGCYVATAVYGSYDCPQVWTLRRFRDYTLAETWYGRLFIRTYYAISPTLVKWFGNTEWFKKMWKGTLDKMVNELNAEGVEDTPYEDRKW